MKTPNSAPTISDLQTHTHSGGVHEISSTKRLELPTREGYDVYNPSASFLYEGSQMVAGRVEKRDDELYSETRFFRFNPQDETWSHDHTLPSLPLQDPFVVRLQSQWLVGGVKVYPKPQNIKAVDYWETRLYAGESLHDMHHIFTGPKNMKDIRLVDMGESIGVFTRPQGEKGGLGRIGFVAINDLSELNPQMVYDAPLLEGVIAYDQNEWGGVNEAHAQPDGRIGALGHLAKFVTSNGLLSKKYVANTFIFNPGDMSVENQQIVACRDCFPAEIQPKTEALHDVVFPGGMTFSGNTAVLNAGVGDASAWQKVIVHPFK